MNEKPDENPYKAPQAKPLDQLVRGRPSVSLALVVYIPITLFVVMALISSAWEWKQQPRDARAFFTFLAAMVWLGAVVWLIRRVVRRHRKAAPQS